LTIKSQLAFQTKDINVIDAPRCIECEVQLRVMTDAPKLSTQEIFAMYIYKSRGLSKNEVSHIRALLRAWARSRNRSVAELANACLTDLKARFKP